MMDSPGLDFWPHFQGQPMTREQIGVEVSAIGFRTFNLLQAEEKRYVERDTPEYIASMTAIIDQESA